MRVNMSVNCVPFIAVRSANFLLGHKEKKDEKEKDKIMLNMNLCFCMQYSDR